MPHLLCVSENLQRTVLLIFFCQDKCAHMHASKCELILKCVTLFLTHNLGTEFFSQKARGQIATPVVK